MNDTDKGPTATRNQCIESYESQLAQLRASLVEARADAERANARLDAFISLHETLDAECPYWDSRVQSWYIRQVEHKTLREAIDAALTALLGKRTKGKG